MELRNKRIIITGASSGIGLRLVHKLLGMQGVKIVGVARDIKTLKKIRSSRLYPLSLDVTVPENVEFMIGEAINLMGGLDIIIACAGFAYYERFGDVDYEHIKRIYETNVLSPLFTLNKFLEKTGGRISFVLISSALGKFGLAGYALYCSTKYALDGFSKSFRFEPHKRLHFMTVYPIGARTNFWRRIHLDMPLPRPLQSADTVAAAVIKGIEKEQRSVYTSRAFRFIWRINSIFPLFIRIYQEIHKRKFKKWLHRQSIKNQAS